MYRTAACLRKNMWDIRDRILFYQEHIYDNVYFSDKEGHYKGFFNMELENNDSRLNSTSFLSLPVLMIDVKEWFLQHPGKYRIPVLKNMHLVGEYYDSSTLGASLYKKIEDRALDLINYFQKDIFEWAENKKIKIKANSNIFNKLKKIINNIEIFDPLNTDNAIVIDCIFTDSFRKKLGEEDIDCIQLSSILIQLLTKRLYQFLSNNAVKFYVVEGIKKSTLMNLNNEELFYLEKPIECAINDIQHVNRICSDDKDSYNYLIKHQKDINRISKFVHNGIYNVLLPQKEKYFNVINGQRLTLNIPPEVHQKVHMFGPCIVQGLCVADSQTIASKLQNIVNDVHIPHVQFCNHGLSYGKDLLNDLLYMMSTDYSKGDIVIWLSGFSQEEIQLFHQLGITIIDGTSCLSGYHDWFFNIPFHCNALANQILANQIFSAISKDLNGLNQTYIGNFINTNKIPLHYDPECIVNSKEMSDFIDELRPFAITDYKYKQIGCIVMNANPCTNGHLWLIKEALKNIDFLFVFLIQESKNSFDYMDREYMLKENLKNMDNVCLLPSGNVLATEISFPEYFNRNDCPEHIKPTLDNIIFGKCVAPVLNIKHRFLGSETNDKITKMFNQECLEILPKFGIKVHILSRLENNGIPISSKTVRSLLKTRNYKEIAKLVPFATYRRLLELQGDDNNQNINIYKSINRYYLI